MFSSIWSSFWIALDGTFCIMSWVRSIISSRVSLLSVNCEECLRLRVALHCWPHFPFPHLQRNLSITLSLFQRDMLLPHLEQGISLFKSPHSCKNFTPLSLSENKNPKKQFVRKTISPHYTTPEGSFWYDRPFLHFVLVGINYS